MKRFLTKVDISGIQNFIFDVNSKGAAKELKAKSFYVMILTEFIRKKFEDEFGENYEFLYDGGGNAFFIISALDDHKIIELEKRFSSEQNIRILISHQEIIEPFTENFQKLNEKITKLKYRQCPVREPININELKTIDWNIITDKIKTSRGYTIKAGSSSKELTLNYADYYIDFSDENDKLINNPNTILPMKYDSLKPYDFDEIGELLSDSDANYLGALKLDVDNLGNLFRQLIKLEQFQALSKLIGEFFSKDILYILLDVEFDNRIYVVFSGGDDCFLIGPWDYMFKLAIVIREKFDKYIKNVIKMNEDLKNLDFNCTTLSASLIVTPTNFPMQRIAEMAENELHKAKTKDDSKNKISVFGYILNWEDFEDARDIANTLTELITKKGETRAIIQRIIKSHKGFEPLFKKAQKGKIEIPAIWRFKYYLRNSKNEENRAILENEIFSKYSSDIFKKFMNPETKDVNPDKYMVAARWAEYLTKNKQTEELNDV